MKKNKYMYRYGCISLVIWLLFPFVASAQTERYLLLLNEKSKDANDLFPAYIFLDISPVVAGLSDNGKDFLQINQQLYKLRTVSFFEAGECFEDILGINSMMSCCMTDSIFAPSINAGTRYLNITRNMSKVEVDSLDKHYRFLYEQALKAKKKIIGKCQMKNQIADSYKHRGYSFDMYLYLYNADVCSCMEVYWSNSGSQYGENTYITKLDYFKIATANEVKLFKNQVNQIMNAAAVRDFLDSFLE